MSDIGDYEEEQIYELPDEIEEEEEEEEEEVEVEEEEEEEEEEEYKNDIISQEDEDYEVEDVEEFRRFENMNYIETYHPEDIHISFDEMYKLSLIKRDENGIIIDDNHKTYPILSKYEKTKLIGLRVTQINKGSTPYVNSNMFLEPSLIAEQELKEKRIPFIIKRPLPNGKYEYWNVKDLEII